MGCAIQLTADGIVLVVCFIILSGCQIRRLASLVCLDSVELLLPGPPILEPVLSSHVSCVSEVYKGHVADVH